MKQLAGLTAGAIALAAAYCGPAAADGMPRRAAPPPAAPVVQDRCAPGPWTGFYVGGNLGWAHLNGEFEDHDKFFSDKSRFDHDDDGFTIGVQSGYNLQCGNVVFGFESDFNWVDLDDDRRHKRDKHFWGEDDDGFRHGRSADWVSTLRGRIGWTNDRILVYATGGAAFTNLDRDFSGRGRDEHEYHGWGISDRHHGSDDVQWGWVAGGGVEFLHSDRFTIKAEALWIQFDNDGDNRKVKFEEAYPCGGYCDSWEKNKRFSQDDDMVLVRVGVNYKFGDRTPVYEPLK